MKTLIKIFAWLIAKFARNKKAAELKEVFEQLAKGFTLRQEKPHPAHNSRKQTKGRKLVKQMVQVEAGTRIIYHETIPGKPRNQPTKAEKRYQAIQANTGDLNDPPPERAAGL